MSSAESLVYDAVLKRWEGHAKKRVFEPARVRIGASLVGEGTPVYVIAEIGINHNGSVELAKQLIEGAKRAGCDAVKFQKRTPELCVPYEQWSIERDTPWGRMTYIDYKRRIEFGEVEFQELDQYCKKLGIAWFASCWDAESVAFMEQFEPPCYKVASASLTDHELLAVTRATARPIILSTGMSTVEEIEAAVEVLGTEDLLIAHATSTYPCPAEELNLKMIATLKSWYPLCPVGYSGHEQGVAATVAAVALGATFIERHITLDRSMWGSDHGASVEVESLAELVSQVREIERAVGDGVKRVYDSEVPVRARLRRVSSLPLRP